MNKNTQTGGANGLIRLSPESPAQTDGDCLRNEQRLLASQPLEQRPQALAVVFEAGEKEAGSGDRAEDEMGVVGEDGHQTGGEEQRDRLDVELPREHARL